MITFCDEVTALILHTALTIKIFLLDAHLRNIPILHKYDCTPISHLPGNVTQSSSSGALEIFLQGKWGDVCYTPEVNQQAADLACRQMGYTNVKTYNGTLKKSSIVTWLNGIHCGRSAQCGNPTNCFKYPVKDNICSGGYLYIQCVFVRKLLLHLLGMK